LSDGRKIWLDSISAGPIAGIADAHVQKLDSGTLSYTGSSIEGMHILETPRAGTFKVILPDGTRVWLNNESRLQYPPSFTGTDRTVLLTGEAYFEVAQDAKKPFRVRIGELSLGVLGTHFNVSAYPNEKEVTTTLLAGSVRLDKDDAHVVLKPGEQGVFVPGQVHAEMQVLQHIDTDNIVAWKEGKFYFFHADLLSVLRQLSRWYNVDIVFQGPPSKRPFDLERKRTDISLFWILDQWSLHYHWEDKKLIVTE
jgi:transmembrane sensor